MRNRSASYALCCALAALAAVSIDAEASAQTTIVNPGAAAKIGGVPQFQVDALWPKPLPNNWILGQVSGIRVDRRFWCSISPGI